MADDCAAEKFSAEELAECAEREFRMRRDKYPHMQGGMTKFRERQTAMMGEIARLLRARCRPAATQETLFAPATHRDEG